MVHRAGRVTLPGPLTRIRTGLPCNAGSVLPLMCLGFTGSKMLLHAEGPHRDKRLREARYGKRGPTKEGQAAGSGIEPEPLHTGRAWWSRERSDRVKDRRDE